MDFQKQNIVDFLKTALETVPGLGCGPQTLAVNNLPKSFGNLEVDASVGIGRATSIPWITFIGYDQKTSNGIYPVLLFYHEQNLLVVAFGISVTNVPKETWGISGLKTLGQYFTEHRIHQSRIEQKYNSSFVHSVFPVPTIGDKLDESRFNVDGVYSSLIDLCDKYRKHFEGKKGTFVMEVLAEKTPFIKEGHKKNPFDINKLKKIIGDTELIYEDNMIKRLVYSLQTKPFVILSGLAGSGKTQLALALAKSLVEDEKKQMCVVSVGADWTNREPLLGFPNALEAGKYVAPENGVLDLLIDCNKEANKQKPYFLILDEMNLSYVERYFADFLSVMESHEEIKLWKKSNDTDDDTPEAVKLPKNLFIIGTINVDETTYMFSPKVLDRANVIEFKVSEEDMDKFLGASPNVDMSKCEGKAANMAEDFVKIASSDKEMSTLANDTLKKFFKSLKAVNAEFGYRTATEIGRFISLAKDDMGETEAIDSAIVQKLLPKLHGSRKKLIPVLKELWKLCRCEDIDKIETPNPAEATYKLTADKVLRMYNVALDNGFASFAEA